MLCSAPQLRKFLSPLSALAATILAGLPLPAQVEKAYISNTDAGTVSVIEVATRTILGSPITVGSEPRGSSALPNGSRIFVPNRFSATVSVIDTSVDLVIATVSLSGSEPYNSVVHPSGSTLYVCNKGSSTVSVIDLTTLTETTTVTLVGNSPEGLAILPDGSKLYVVNRQSDSVDVIDTATNGIVASAIPVISAPRDAAVGAAPIGSGREGKGGSGEPVWVVGEGGITVIDSATDTVSATLSASGLPRDIVMSPDGMTAYITNMTSGVVVFDVPTNTHITDVAITSSSPPSSGTPYAIALNGAGSTALVALQGSDEVAAVDLVALTQLGGFTTVGSGPRGIAIGSGNAAGVLDGAFMPRRIQVTLRGGGRDRLDMVGFLDLGTTSPNLGGPVVIGLGGFQRNIPGLTPKHSGIGLRFLDSQSKVRLWPSYEHTSRAKFRIRLEGDLSAIGPLSGPLTTTFQIDTLLATSSVQLENGLFSFKQREGDFLQPQVYLHGVRGRVVGSGGDRAALFFRFDPSGSPPATWGDLNIVAGAFSETIPSASLSSSRYALMYQGGTSGVVRVQINFRTGLAQVLVRDVDFGALTPPDPAVQVGLGFSAGGPWPLRLQAVRMKRNNHILRY